MQAEPLMNPDRFPLIPGGIQGGKSFGAAAILLPHILALPSLRRETFYDRYGKPAWNEQRDLPWNPHFALVGPNYKDTAYEFEYIQEWLKKLGKLSTKHLSRSKGDSWQMVTTDGVVLKTLTGDNPEAIRSYSFEAAVACEAGGMAFAVTNNIRERIATKRGFLVMEGTLEASQQWWRDACLEGLRPNARGYVTYKLPTWANLAMYPGGENDPEIVAMKDWMGEDLWLERVAAQPQPPRYRVLKEFEPHHVGEIDIPEDASIEIWIDPGYASAYAVLWVAHWPKGDTTHFYFFDEIYEQGKNTYEIVDMIRLHPMFNRLGKDRVIDIGAQGHRDSTDSALEVWEALLPGNYARKMWMEDRLMERLRVSARLRQFTINPKCRGFLAEAGLGEPVFPEQHPWRYPTDKDGRIIGEKPIDRWNHSAKAAGYGLLKHLGQVEIKRKATSFNRLQKVNFPIHGQRFRVR